MSTHRCLPLWLLLVTAAAHAADMPADPGLDIRANSSGEQIYGPKCLGMRELGYGLPWVGGFKPCTDAEYQAWLAEMRQFRLERRIRVGADGSRYEVPALKWTQASFIQPQMMVQDRYFYDPVAHRYTVGRYLDDLKRRYGGIDAVLIWPTYPNMGIDNRTQLDMVRAMPGGVDGVRQMVAEFHRQGVRVLFPMMMWDQGTRDPGGPWPDAIASLMAEVGADGINGDTQDGVPRAFSDAADRTGHPLAFEPELAPHDDLERLPVFLCAFHRSVQVARAAPHGEHIGSLAEG